MGQGLFTPRRAEMWTGAMPDITGGTLKVILLDMDDETPAAITDATNATPIVITATAHGLANGDRVAIQGVGGNTAANGTFVVANVAANTFELTDKDGNNVASNGVYTSGGTIMDLEKSTYDEIATLAKVSDAVALASVAVTGGVLTATSPVTITGAGAGEDPCEGLLYFNDTGTPTTSKLIGFKGSDIISGLPVTPNGQNITLTLDTNIFRITQ